MSILRYIPVLVVCLTVGGLRAMEPVAYTDLSDEELRGLVQRWETLGVVQRRAVATEINRRRARAERGVLRVEAERRYGYRVRRPDGSVVTVQGRRKIIRYVDPDQPYGVGFEERVGADPAPAAPLERVIHQNPNPR